MCEMLICEIELEESDSKASHYSINPRVRKYEWVKHSRLLRGVNQVVPPVSEPEIQFKSLCDLLNKKVVPIMFNFCLYFFVAV